MKAPDRSGALDAPPPRLPPAGGDSVPSPCGGIGDSHLSIMSGALDSLASLAAELERLSRSVVDTERELRTLITLTQTVERGILLEEVLVKIYESFAGVIPFERIGCAFLSEDSEQLVSYWAKSELGPIQIKKEYAQRLAGSSLEQIIKTGEPRIINDLEAYLAAKPGSDATRRIVAEGGRSNLTCPLTADNGRPIGFLFFTSRYLQAYRDVHQYVFRQISGQVASVIERSRGHQHLVDSNRALIERGHVLEKLATRDVLTGALNRGAIDGVLAHLVRENQGSFAPAFSLIMVDVDHFKKINDTFGHPAGDLVLKELVRRLKGGIRRPDVLGRYGGEEFLIIVDEPKAEHLFTAMERLRTAICAATFNVGSQQYPVTASFGGIVAMPGTSSADLIRKVDKALYEAKAKGRNRSVIGDSGIVPVNH